MKQQFLPLLRVYKFSKRFSSSNSASKKQICVVGAGPAGFYAAQYLAKHLSEVQIDILERLPVPFGLVRYGVAPDHPEVKNVISTFTKTALNPAVSFRGNIELGVDVSLQQLRDCYHAVLLTYGADQDKTLNIPGEKSPYFLSAREFVGWYNGNPNAKDLNPYLHGNHVVVLGQGNVAVDVARILLTPIDLLKTTDITEHALAALATSKVQVVSLVGRRGPLQAAFTIKELREMLKLPNCTTRWRSDDFENVTEAIPNLARPRKRLTELMLKSVAEMNASRSSSGREFCPIFYRSPLKFSEGSDGIKQAEFAVNKLDGDNAVATDLKETLQCDLVLRSIGYKSIKADSELSFDSKGGYVPNKQGRVITGTTECDNYETGLYVAGWLRTGPTGVILTTMNNAFEVASIICADFNSNQISHFSGSKAGFKQLRLEKQVVDWKGWERIDTAEVAAGKAIGKIREKILDVKEMLKIANC